LRAKPKRERLEEIELALSEVQEGDIIEVHFLDCSRCQNVRKVTNKDFATYKKVVGRFWRIEMDALYQEEYIILWSVLTDYEKRDIISVPMATVQRITIFSEEKVRLKNMSNVGMPMLTGSDAKPVMSEEGVGEQMFIEGVSE